MNRNESEQLADGSMSTEQEKSSRIILSSPLVETMEITTFIVTWPLSSKINPDCDKILEILQAEFGGDATISLQTDVAFVQLKM